MPEIHKTAIVDPSVPIGVGSRIGAYTIIEKGATIGRNCEIQDHVVIRGLTRLGDNVRVFPFAVLGAEPQHLRYHDEETTVVIGDRVVIREAVTIHRGTGIGIKTTVVGDDSYLMAYVHIAHDCIVGKGVIMANGVQLAGHTEVEDRAVLGGLTGISQHCRVGRFCFTGSGSMIRKDLPPFMTGKGSEFRVQGINSVGLSRNGFSDPTIDVIRTIYKIFYRRHLTVNQALEQIRTELGESDEVKLFLDFVRTSKAGIIR